MLRNRFVRAGALLVIGVLCALSLQSRTAAAEAARSSWGSTEQVFVVVEPVAAGELVNASIELRELPMAMLPEGNVATVSAGSRAKVPLFVGEVLLDERLTTSETRGLVGGTVALTLPVVAQVPLLVERDLVDLWVVDSANLSSQRVATNVMVLAFSDRDITVAVPDGQVEAATVASLRPVTVTLVG